jgi:hypothetical protein
MFGDPEIEGVALEMSDAGVAVNITNELEFEEACAPGSAALQAMVSPGSYEEELQVRTNVGLAVELVVAVSL